MTKRLIVLELDESTTATECGACPSLMTAHGGWQPGCYAFRARIGGNPLGTIWTEYDDQPPKRLPECLAAEQRAARMVEIEPEDAAALCELLVDNDIDMILCNHPDAERAADALHEHGVGDR